MLPAGPNEPGPSDVDSNPVSKPVWRHEPVVGNGGAVFQVRQSGEAVSGQAPSALPDAMTILRALRRRWIPVFLVGALFAAGAGLATRWLLPVKYTARVRFRVASQAPSVVFQSTEGSADFGNYIRTQVELIKSELVLDEVVKRPEVADLTILREQLDPVHWIEQQLVCDFPAPEILRLSLNGKEPQEIETLLSAIKDAYLEKVGNNEKNQRQDSLQRLTSISEKWEKELNQQRKVYRTKAKEAGSGDSQTLQFSHRLVMEELSVARKELLQYQSELRRAEVELSVRTKKQAAKDDPAPAVPDAEIEERIKQDKEMTDLLVQRAEFEKKLKKARREVQEDHPLIGKYRDELKANADALAVRRREVRPSIVKQLNDEKRKPPTSVAQLNEQVDVLRKLVGQLTSEISRLTEETKQIKDSTLELEEMREKIAQIENVAKAVAGRAQAVNLERDAPSRVTLLEKPTVIHVVDGKKQMMAVGCAALAGLALATFSVVGQDLRRRRVFHPGQVSRALNMRVLGTLPVLGTQASMQGSLLAGASPADKYPRDLMTESVDRARLKLLHSAGDYPLRVVLITSAVSGEGKTSLASHLAVSLAQAGRRTLLIDADLRRPALHRIFDLSLEPGLGALLREEVAAADVIRPTYVRGLELIPAGRGDVSAIRALGHDRLRTTLERLKEQYDFILVDSAPMLAVVDAPLIAQHVDGVLFSVMCGVSHLNSLYESHQELSQLGVRILGAVVSGASDSGKYYGYPPPLALTSTPASESV